MQRYRLTRKGPYQQKSADERARVDNAKCASSETDGTDDAVGYCRPPKNRQFKPGQSGNRKGRPKGSRNFKTDVMAMLKAPVRVIRDGKPRKISTQEATLLRVREKGLGGDRHSLDRLIALAQIYNNEEFVASATLSADDASILEIYRARVLSGATAAPDAPRSANDAPERQPSMAPPFSAEAPETKSIERVRLRRRSDSNESPDPKDVGKKR